MYSFWVFSFSFPLLIHKFKYVILWKWTNFVANVLPYNQADAVLRNISINGYCISEGVKYHNFIKWYRNNKKCICEVEMEEIRLSALTVPCPVVWGCRSWIITSWTWLRFSELQSTRRDNKKFVVQLSKALFDRSGVEKETTLLSNALEEQKNLHASEINELDKQKTKC